MLGSRIACQDPTSRAGIPPTPGSRITCQDPTHAQAQVEFYVDRVIDLLGLSEFKHQICGGVARRGISGGQKKRVNIGMELVAEPSLLFLDEPTSGLDSSAALDLMQV